MFLDRGSIPLKSTNSSIFYEIDSILIQYLQKLLFWQRRREDISLYQYVTVSVDRLELFLRFHPFSHDIEV